MFYKFSVSVSKFQHLAWCATLALALAGCNSDDASSTAAQSTATTSAAAQPFIVNGAPPRTTVMSGSLYRYAPAPSDPDHRVLSYSIVNKPSWASFTETTGELSGTPEASDVGTSSEIEIGVSDGTKHANVGPFRIKVTAQQSATDPVPPSSPTAPMIAGTPASSVVAGKPYLFEPIVAGGGSEALSFSIVNRPVWATFNPATGKLSGTPTTANVGSFANILISVSTDGAPVSLRAFSIQVLSAADGSPTISGTPAQSVAAGSDYSFTPVAGDPDGSALTFSILNAPSWASFNKKTGELSGTAPANANGSLVSNIVISVSNGTLTASLPAFTIQVQASTGGSAGSGGGHAIRFHPGYYVELDENQNLTTWLSTIASLKGAKNVAGVMLIMQWNNMEFGEGVYSQGTGENAQGFAAVDQLVAACASANLQFILGYEDRVFGGNAGAYNTYQNGAFLPAYLDTIENGSPGYSVASAGTTFQSAGLQAVADVNNPAVWAREIALGVAYLSRYDTNPNFEMWRTPETANAQFSNSGSWDTYFANYTTWMATLRAAAPHTAISISTNYAGSAQQFSTLFTAAQQYAIAVGGPDIYQNLPEGTAPSYTNDWQGTDQIVFNGFAHSQGWTSDATDWRGKLMRVSEMQGGDLVNAGGTTATYTTLYNYLFTGALGAGGSVKPSYYIIQQFMEGTSISLGDLEGWIAGGGGGPVNTTQPSSY
jgi:hypothetical protein